MNPAEMERAPELLAPAGNVESFTEAIANGADAVYLGLKLFSARASAVNFTLDELALLIPYAHKRRVSVYVALNSLVTALEIPELLNLLQAMADLDVDGLITQDPGVFYLCRKFFPDLPLHGSTLMTVHNHAGVSQLARMGASRVVLARELTLAEIAQITARSEIAVEIFVHGALCYSFSGLCLASSFRGGHSGLQGRCVQPCRLRFRQGRREGFFLSCNDFCGLPLVPRLKRMGIAAMKIEGRMKSADTIAQMVKAYRHVLDAKEGQEAAAIEKALEALSQTPSRRLTSGFLGEHPSSEVLTPHRSGSSGVWVGTVKKIVEGRLVVDLRHPLNPGDRLRPESSEGREKRGMTVTAIYSQGGELLEGGKRGETVLLAGRGDFVPGERLFRVGSKTAGPANVWQKVKSEISHPLPYRKRFDNLKEALGEIVGLSLSPREEPDERLFVKVGRIGEALEALRTGSHLVLLVAARSNLEGMVKRRLSVKTARRFAWSLPPIILERDIDYWQAAVQWYVQKGFTTWEVNNWGHLDFFSKEKTVRLIAGCRLNLRNHAAVAEAAAWGCRSCVLSLEITRTELKHFSSNPLKLSPILTIFAWPPLFTSRLQPPVKEEKPFFTQRQEGYFYRKRGELAFVYADRPTNWLGKLGELRAMGYRQFLIDASDGPDDQPADLSALLKAYRYAKPAEPYSLFNLERNP